MGHEFSAPIFSIYEDGFSNFVTIYYVTHARSSPDSATLPYIGQEILMIPKDANENEISTAEWIVIDSELQYIDRKIINTAP